MICCERCFKDNEIKEIIKSLGNIGDCEVCGNRTCSIYDTNINNNLVDFFEGIIDIYTGCDDLPESFPKGDLHLLKDELNNRWNIFNISSDKIYNLIINICSERYLVNPKIFYSPIAILSSNNEDYLEKNCIFKTYTWDEFKKSILYVNRFHTSIINTNVLQIFCDYIRTPYLEGNVFYRARIANEKGFKKEEMGAPPLGQASAGRINPEGISYLYLASQKEVAIHEIRAAAYDYISMAKFRLKQNIEVIDIEELDKISPFKEIDYTQYAVNKNHLKTISEEIARPIRPQSTKLEYLPVQYICDYLKSQGYNGIKYKSTMCTNGYNIAIFDESLFECIEVSLIDIKELKYSY